MLGTEIAFLKSFHSLTSDAIQYGTHGVHSASQFHQRYYEVRIIWLAQNFHKLFIHSLKRLRQVSFYAYKQKENYNTPISQT